MIYAKINLGNIFVGVKKINSEIPQNFSLSQNYPNPFNPTTTIRFAIPSNDKRETSNVKIIVYNALGSEIQTLVNEQLQPGTYEAVWDGTNYASGIYFYTIKAGNYVDSKKMVLVK